jgi:hypothetical protein
VIIIPNTFREFEKTPSLENLKEEGTRYEKKLDGRNDGSGIFDGGICVWC